ncbi:hypothetical protein BaRGS_00029541 [Batillaria attramentaria]|uniref:Uncharacterized protein n=1 Tax=Batillaria attramentaria TaxID=370345 RepID=A0ABD0JVV6_9CAEN
MKQQTTFSFPFTPRDLSVPSPLPLHRVVTKGRVLGTDFLKKRKAEGCISSFAMSANHRIASVQLTATVALCSGPLPEFMTAHWWDRVVPARYRHHKPRSAQAPTPHRQTIICHTHTRCCQTRPHGP